MKTVGEILATARLKLGLTPDQIAQKTKIQAKFIAALEANDYLHLPEAAFVKGFIRNYALALGLDPKALLAVFRRDFGQDPRGRVIPRGLANPLNQPRFIWTPKHTLLTFFALLLTLFAFYLIYQFRLLLGVPSLRVTFPSDNAIITSTFTVTGTTHPQASLTINSQSVPLNPDGSFSHPVSLPPGKHTLTIISTSRTNRTRTLTRTIIVE